MEKKSVNRQRVARWRKRLTEDGYRCITVFLDRDTMKMLKTLQGHFYARRKMSQLIGMAIKSLYETVTKDITS